MKISRRKSQFKSKRFKFRSPRIYAHEVDKSTFVVEENSLPQVFLKSPLPPENWYKGV